MRKKILAIIEEHVPKHCTYIEPFVGGGSIFFAKIPADKAVINDSSKHLMGFYREVAKGKLQGCRYRHDRKTFDRIMKKHKAGKKLTACEYLTLNKISFSGKMTNFADDNSAVGKTNPKSAKLFNRLSEFEVRLSAAKLLQGDFSKAMEKHDSPCALHFIDPPYEKSTNSKAMSKYYTAGSAEPKDVFKVARKMKGKVIITYGDAPEIRKLFCKKGSGFHCIAHKVSHVGSALASGGHKQANELIITNFPVKRNLI